MYISPRLKIFISVFFLTIFFAGVKLDLIGGIGAIFDNELVVGLLKSTFIGLISYLFIFWIVNFNIKGIKHLTVGVSTSFTLFTFTLFSELSLYRILGFRSAAMFVFLVLIFIALSYFSLLNSNILNLAENQSIPLLKAARTARYIFSIINIYVASLILYSIDLAIPIKLIILFLITLFLSFETLWPVYLKLKENLTLSAGIATTIFSLAFSTLFWPIQSEFLALVITVFFYILIGLAMERNEKVYKSLYIEYLFVVVICLIFAIASAQWGINGTLLDILRY